MEGKILLFSRIFGGVFDRIYDDIKNSREVPIIFYDLVESLSNGRDLTMEQISYMASDRISNDAKWDKETFFNSCKNGHLELAKWIKFIRPDIDPTDEHNVALRFACTNGHLNVAKWLIETFNANPETYSYEAFVQASGNGHLEVVKYLREILKSIPTTKMFDAFEYASKLKHREVVIYLIKTWKLDINMLDTIVKFSFFHGYIYILELLDRLYPVLPCPDIHTVSNIVEYNRMDTLKWGVEKWPEILEDSYSKRVLELLERRAMFFNETLKWYISEAERYSQLMRVV